MGGSYWEVAALQQQASSLSSLLIIAMYSCGWLLDTVLATAIFLLITIVGSWAWL
ncbi:MAG: hypothetical protein GY696_29535 [Gammaproteobacteria bacterium]|nr:hypothetical protein [Gammaproteobacteria bacterium]